MKASYCNTIAEMHKIGHREKSVAHVDPDGSIGLFAAGRAAGWVLVLSHCRTPGTWGCFVMARALENLGEQKWECSGHRGTELWGN